MKTIAVEYRHPLSQGDLCLQSIACQANGPSNTYHKTPATQPLVSFLGPFISRFIQAGIYFALDDNSPILPGTTSNRPTNKITGEQ